MAIDKALLDQLLAGRDPQELFAKDGLLDDLKKALSERILNAELDEHLGSEREEGVGNRRNGVCCCRHICRNIWVSGSKRLQSCTTGGCRHN